MARNPNLTKLRLQKFKRRRGTFKPLSEDSLNGSVYIDPALRKFWGAQIKGRSSVDRSQIPDSYRGYVDYRGHAKTLGQEEQLPLTPQRATFLNAIMPGVKLVGEERKRVLQRIDQLNSGLPPDQLFAFVELEITRFKRVLLFYNGRRDCFFLVEQTSTTVRRSITYGTSERAKQVAKDNSVRWYSPQSNTS